MEQFLKNIGPLGGWDKVEIIQAGSKLFAKLSVTAKKFSIASHNDFSIYKEIKEIEGNYYASNYSNLIHVYAMKEDYKLINGQSVVSLTNGLQQIQSFNAELTGVRSNISYKHIRHYESNLSLEEWAAWLFGVYFSLSKSDAVDDKLFNSREAQYDASQEKIRNKTVAIAGVGGTGSNILDMLVRSGVKKIHIIDMDKLEESNMFRMCVNSKELVGQPKVEALKTQYKDFDVEIIAHNSDVKTIDFSELKPDYIFSAIDNIEARKAVINQAKQNNTPGVDVGIWVDIPRNSTQIEYSVRVSNILTLNPDNLAGAAGAYEQPIQIVDLNVLNASLAVVKMKEHFDFYNRDEIKPEICFNWGWEFKTSEKAI